MATITTRIADDKKEQAQKLAKDLGLSLSSLINIRVNDFLRTKSLHIELEDDTSLEFYHTNDAIEVNEPIENVIDYVKASLKNK